MRFFLLFFLVTLCFYVNGQVPPDRYQEAVFTDFVETQNVLFSTGVPQPTYGGGFYEFITGLPLNADEFDTDPVNLFMDIFEPMGDTASKRPLIIICFGGGFLSGSRDHWSIRLLCQDLAKRGYVTATIDYRLGMNVFDSDLANRAVYRGVQDGRAAVRYFRADAAGANTYRIDTSQIFIGGHSAGAFVGLHNVYLDKEVERPLSTFQWTQSGNTIPDLGCLDCAGDNQEYSGKATSVFSLAGAVGFVTFLEDSTDAKPVLFHSTDDGTVPYNSGSPFSSIIWLVVGSDLPDVFGSLPISQRCDVLGIPYEFYSYTNRGHGVHENGGSALYDDIVPGISDWFYEEYLKPEPTILSGRTLVCDDTLVQRYYAHATGATYLQWQVQGGTFAFQSPFVDSATVIWDDIGPIHAVSVRPFNEIGASGDTTELAIDLQPNVINQWLGGNGNFDDALKWSLGHGPKRCEDIVFPVETLSTEILAPDGYLGQMRSITLGSNVTLRMQPAARVEVLAK